VGRIGFKIYSVVPGISELHTYRQLLNIIYRYQYTSMSLWRYYPQL